MEPSYTNFCSEDFTGDLTRHVTDYFGPQKDAKFTEYKDIPYASFNRMEKLSKYLESTQQSTQTTNKPYRYHYQNDYQPRGDYHYQPRGDQHYQGRSDYYNNRTENYQPRNEYQQNRSENYQGRGDYHGTRGDYKHSRNDHYQPRDDQTTHYQGRGGYHQNRTENYQPRGEYQQNRGENYQPRGDTHTSRGDYKHSRGEPYNQGRNEQHPRGDNYQPRGGGGGGQHYQHQSHYQQQQQSQYPQQQQGDDNQEFISVEASKKSQAGGKPHFNRRGSHVKPIFGNERNKISRYEQPNQRAIQQKRKTNGPNQQGRYAPRAQLIKFREPITMKQSWQPQGEILYNNVEKTKLGSVEITELKRTGVLQEWNALYDRASRKKPVKLQIDKQFYANTETLKDSTILEFFQQNSSTQEKKNFTVYATDTFLVSLMNMQSSEFPWYIWLAKENNNVIMDKYDKESNRTHYLDMLTINENSTQHNALPNEENQVVELCLESTAILKSLQHNALRSDSQWQYSKEGNENTVQQSHGAFRYVQATIDGTIDVITRVEIDAFTTDRDQDGEPIEAPVLIRSINEYDLKQDWRNKNEGEVMSSQISYNISNFCKWMCQMKLAGAEHIKIASVSKSLNKDDKAHEVLHVQSQTYQSLRKNLNFEINTCWKVLKHIIEYIKNLEDAQYILIHNAYKQGKLSVYKLPKEEDAQEENDEDAEDIDELVDGGHRARFQRDDEDENYDQDGGDQYNDQSDGSQFGQGEQQSVPLDVPEEEQGPIKDEEDI